MCKRRNFHALCTMSEFVMVSIENKKDLIDAILYYETYTTFL